MKRSVLLTATKYHLSSPNVLLGKFCSMVSKRAIASAAVGSWNVAMASWLKDENGFACNALLLYRNGNIHRMDG